MPETHFDEWIAARYERLWPELFDPATVDPAVEVLAALADGGPCLEFGVGTGRIAVPLAGRGLRVHGIELSPAMAARARGSGVTVTVGDFATARVGGGPYALVCLLRNTITNLTTQPEQVAAFRNAAAHLRPGGRFVVENYVPRPPRGEAVRLVAATPGHVAYEEYDEVAQVAVSRHHWVIDGELRTFASPHRYVWPGELDLMAELAGLRRAERWADWHRGPFTAAADGHVTVYQLRA